MTMDLVARAESHLAQNQQIASNADSYANRSEWIGIYCCIWPNVSLCAVPAVSFT